MNELVRLEKVTKNFSGTTALSHASLTLHKGEVHALVGENGAGKSTLMKILGGVYPSGTFTGEIFWDGTPVKFFSPKDAETHGIAMIHQELSPFPDLSIAENLFVGNWPTTKLGAIDWKTLYEKSNHWLGQVGAKVEAHSPMMNVSVGSQQLVEIAKALARMSRVLVFDEPTSALTTKETDHLFRLIRGLKAEGKAVVYISHKMEEIFEISDRITVLRDGKVIETMLTKDTTEKKLIDLMVGRSLDQRFPHKVSAPKDEIVLKLHHVAGHSKTGDMLFGPIDLELKRGEIVGLAGLLGAGRTELMKALIGCSDIRLTGDIEVLGKKLEPKNPREGLRHRMVYVSEDRKRESLFPGQSLENNFSISRLAAGSTGMTIRPLVEIKNAEEKLKNFRTRYHNVKQEIQELSGGNQQKVVIARSLEVSPDIILLDEPTRGVDVGAKFEIYQILFELAALGKGIVLASSELPELIGICDRIYVLHEGKQKGFLKRPDFSQSAIMNLAIGTETLQ